MEEAIPASKKRRLQGSCDSCKARKTRCDSATRPGLKCSNCANLGIECTHVAAMSRKNGGIPINLIATAVEDSGSVKHQLSSILSHDYTPPSDPKAVDTLLKSLAQYAKQLEGRLERAELRLSRMCNTTPSSSTTSDPPDPANIGIPMGDLLLDARSRRFGRSRDAKHIDAALNLKEQLDPTHRFRRPEFWYAPEHPWEYLQVVEPPGLRFPSPDLLNELVAIFLRNLNRHVHLIHGPSFVRQIATGYHYVSHAFGSVVLAVCAIAARYSDDPRVGNGHHKGWNYYSQLKAVHTGQYLEADDFLFNLQLFPLMVLYAYSLLLPEQCWLLTGMGVRLAQAGNVHRKRTSDKPWTANDEMLKRAWWCLVILDTYVSSFDGRTRMTSFEEFDVDFPLEVDDEYWPGEPLAEPQQPWRQPANTHSRVSGWVCHLKLLEIYSFGLTTIYNIRRAPLWDSIGCPAWNRNVVDVLDASVNKWLDNIPEHLRWDPHAPDPVALVLRCTYDWVIIQIHRPFKKDLSSTAACVTAARSLAHALAAYSKVLPQFPLPTAFGWLTFSSVVLLLNIARDKQSGKTGSGRDVDDINKNMELLATNEGTWQVAGRYHDIIREVFDLLQGPVLDEAAIQRKDKRPRDPDGAPTPAGIVDASFFPAADLGFGPSTGAGPILASHSGDPTAAWTWDGLDLDAWQDSQLNVFFQNGGGWGGSGGPSIHGT
ncbi:hypothetical protein CYLTODRAFT_419143 [Cylindrobasidium torrendii FP15055 ss-10]|uniref:Zn(2)-C6 fungal-type domain-containing protein n=1 Tax=Cylindrobasidium torrendii FP15055 ss-10 TaxID=1314674 RepID=A0A0D7BNH7_9AGAR|nr:hypothetical protein CYLTODRAFT_419143 [Cylindrobasidium torrendii FP15055 ss-10]